MAIIDLLELKNTIIDVIKIKPNTDPTKTQGVRLQPLLINLVDTLLGSINKVKADLQGSIDKIVIPVLPDFTQFAKTTDIPTIPTYDFSVYQKTSDKIPYSRLTGTPNIPTYDLAPYQKTTDTIAYSRLTGAPTPFDGTWGSLSGKPTLVTSYSQLSDKPTIITSYTQLTDKPTIPTYDLSIYRKTTDQIDYTTLANRPTIISDYSQLANKPNMSRLLWNQTSVFTLSNSIVETNALVTGNGSLVLDANPPINTTFRLTGRGLFNTQTLGPTPTLTIKLYLGNTVIATGSVASFLLGATNRPLSFYVDMSITGTNAIYAHGSMSYFATLADNLSAAPILNGTGNSATVDLSIANQLKMTLTWSVANVSNSIQMKIINLEKLNN